MAEYVCPNMDVCPKTAEGSECPVFMAGILPHEAENMVIQGFPRDELVAGRNGEVIVQICEKTLANPDDPRTHAFEHTWSDERKGPGFMYPVLSGRLADIARKVIGHTNYWNAVAKKRNKQAS